MEFTKVIKVKYGETIRRFNARVDENKQLDLDMDRLRAKVVSLFNFSPDSDLTLTYIDEDGDFITLFIDDDLCDAMRQNLNPLRINVLLKAEKIGSAYTRSSGSSTPMRSPQVQQPLPSINMVVAEALKSMPEPFFGALSRLSLDLASKAAYTAPAFVELVEVFSRMGQSYLNPASHFQTGFNTNTQSGSSPSPPQPSVATDPDVSKDDGCVSEVMPRSSYAEPASKNIQDVVIGNVTRGVGTSVTHLPPSIDLNLPDDSAASGCATMNLGLVTSVVPADKSKEESKSENNGNLTGSEGYVKCVRNASKLPEFGTKTSQQFPSNLGNSTMSQPGSSTFNECPFYGMPLENDSDVPPVSFPSIHTCKRSHNHSDNIHIFHRGVRCDGCGVHPITGPRFNSKVKENYDLCSVCFAEMGNEAEYIRMDRPVPYWHPWPGKGLHDHQPRVHPPTPPHLLRGRIKPNHHKVDSRFIMDVNVIDGTVMAPSTRFTKIWRMRNNGSMVWPQRTQLVWIGGDRFSETDSVQIETPVDGLPVDAELDIAVDFRAPELPGRYTSFWRMSLPSGKKFGQRVWVLIQVDASLNDSVCDIFRGLNLNLPPESSGSKAAEFLDVNVNPLVDGCFPEHWNSNATLESVDKRVGARPIKDQELNFPINDTLLVGSGASNTVPPKVSSSVSYPVVNSTEVPVAVFSHEPPNAPTVSRTVDFAKVPSITNSHEPSLVMDALTSSKGVNENCDVELTLLKELEEMGFKQVDLNKEILRMNEYDLGRSVDDLCGVSDWDPILEELEEMGFTDKEMNKKLLMKNNGSIKRAVMDLIVGEKATAKEKTQ